MSVRTGIWFIVLLLTIMALFAFIWAGSPPPAAHAQEADGYTPDDTLQAIENAADETGVSRAFLRRVVSCETGGTFSNYKVGRAGELGAVQLHPRGELPSFYADGFDDPHNPYESVLFLAQNAAAGHTRPWTCAA